MSNPMMSNTLFGHTVPSHPGDHRDTVRGIPTQHSQGPPQSANSNSPTVVSSLVPQEVDMVMEDITQKLPSSVGAQIMHHLLGNFKDPSIPPNSEHTSTWVVQILPRHDRKYRSGKIVKYEQIHRVVFEPAFGVHQLKVYIPYSQRRFLRRSAIELRVHRRTESRTIFHESSGAALFMSLSLVSRNFREWAYEGLARVNPIVQIHGTHVPQLRGSLACLLPYVRVMHLYPTISPDPRFLASLYKYSALRSIEMGEVTYETECTGDDANIDIFILYCGLRARSLRALCLAIDSCHQYVPRLSWPRLPDSPTLSVFRRVHISDQNLGVCLSFVLGRRILPTEQPPSTIYLLSFALVHKPVWQYPRVLANDLAAFHAAPADRLRTSTPNADKDLDPALTIPRQEQLAPSVAAQVNVQDSDRRIFRERWLSRAQQGHGFRNLDRIPVMNLIREVYNVPLLE